jgi:hypothetical protein
MVRAFLACTVSFFHLQRLDNEVFDHFMLPFPLIGSQDAEGVEGFRADLDRSACGFIHGESSCGLIVLYGRIDRPQKKLEPWEKKCFVTPNFPENLPMG